MLRSQLPRSPNGAPLKGPKRICPIPSPNNKPLPLFTNFSHIIPIHGRREVLVLGVGRFIIGGEGIILRLKALFEQLWALLRCILDFHGPFFRRAKSPAPPKLPFKTPQIPANRDRRPLIGVHWGVWEGRQESSKFSLCLFKCWGLRTTSLGTVAVRWARVTRYPKAFTSSGCFHKMGGPFVGPYHNSPTIWGLYWGPLVAGNSQEQVLCDLILLVRYSSTPC